MLRNWIMLAAALGVMGAMALTLRWFFRRLRRIQEEMWGKENVKPFRISFALRKREEKG
jgi:hypothetical protein